MKVDKAFGDWRLQVFWAAMVFAAGLGGISVGWAWRDLLSSGDPKFAIDVLIAVGTLGTAVAAVTVPIFQNLDRRKEQIVQKLELDLAIAMEAQKVGEILKAHSEALAKTEGMHSASMIQHVQTQLLTAKISTTDRLGKLLLEDMLQLVVSLLEEVERRRKNQEESEISDGIYVLTNRPQYVEKFPEISEHLNDRAEYWLSSILERFKEIGVNPPGIVYGAGTARIGIQASAHGSAQESTAPPTGNPVPASLPEPQSHP